MAQSIVSKNFVSCLKELKATGRIRSDREFALTLDFLPQNLSQILKGKRDVTIDLVRRAHQQYDFNLSYIFTGTGDRIERHENSNQSNGLPLSLLPYIDDRSVEIYLSSLNGNGSEWKDINAWHYQGSNDQEDARMFRMGSKDLAPFIEYGDKLITKRIPKNRWARMIRNHFVYVLIEPDRISTSRLINRISSDGVIEIVRNPSFHISGETIKVEEILEVWEITHIITRWSPDSNFENSTLSDRLHRFQHSLDHNADSIKELNKTMQKLLKQNREQISVF